MKIRQLKDSLLVAMTESEAERVLTSISHWVRTLKVVGYPEAKPADIAALERMEKLRIITMERKGSKATVSLTKDGIELYQEFLSRGYY